MSDMTHPVLVDGRWVHLPVAAMGGEALVLPNVAALVHPPGSPDSILLQRRDKPGEAVRGRLEIPMGRWRAGETPAEAVVREMETMMASVIQRTIVWVYMTSVGCVMALALRRLLLSL